MSLTFTPSIRIAGARETLWRVVNDPFKVAHWNLGIVRQTTWQPRSPIVLTGVLVWKRMGVSTSP
jgi:hypothetical protein